MRDFLKRFIFSLIIISQLWIFYQFHTISKFLTYKGILIMPQKNHDGNYLSYHLCRVDTKKGTIKGEENFKKEDEAWVICGISKDYRTLDLMKK